jgi:hypothetical protein
VSYCRFGDDSDVYVYRAALGWTTHVSFVDGGTLDATATDCANRLEQLRQEGRQVPQRAIDRLRREAVAEGCGA